MTSEERERMNILCLGIQEERDYSKFSAMLQEMSDLIARKEQRRFQQYPKLTWQRNKPWKSVSAVVQKTVKPIITDQPEKVEIAIPAADHLFREIRIENKFTTTDGGQVSLVTGTKLTVTLEAETTETPTRNLR